MSDRVEDLSLAIHTASTRIGNITLGIVPGYTAGIAPRVR